MQQLIGLYAIQTVVPPQGIQSTHDVFLAGHVNEKNFVGLSVTPDGYIACGSEDNSVYAYYKALPSPVTQHRFSCNDPTASEDYCFDPLESHQFMSSVCWSQKGHTLLAANSLGTIKLLQLAA